MPKVTPLKDEDPEKRVLYAEKGPITHGGRFGIVTLSEDWEERKKEIFWGDDKPWWIDSSSAKNRYYYDFGDGSGPPEKLSIDKHTPHFMNFHGFGWHSKVLFTFFTSRKIESIGRRDTPFGTSRCWGKRCFL